MFRWIIFLLTVASLTQGRMFALLKIFHRYVIFAIHKTRQLVYMLNVHKRRLVLKCLKKIEFYLSICRRCVLPIVEISLSCQKTYRPKLRNYYQDLHNLKTSSSSYKEFF